MNMDKFHLRYASLLAFFVILALATTAVALAQTPPPPLVFAKDIQVVTMYPGAGSSATLPAASGGTGSITYSLATPSNGLSFTASSRTLASGATTVKAVAPVSYTMTATDSASTPQTATTTIAVMVVDNSCGVSTATGWRPDGWDEMSASQKATLTRDCNLLLAAKSSISGSPSSLNWSVSTPIKNWEGIGVDDLYVVNWLKPHDDFNGGSVPPQLAGLDNLDIIQMGGQGKTGGIPREFGSLPRLRLLDLSGNKLSGAVPKELASTNLRQLDL